MGAPGTLPRPPPIPRDRDAWLWPRRPSEEPDIDTLACVLLGAPAGLSAEQRARFAATVRRHNAVVFPRLIAAAPQAMSITSLSVCRDVVWWMTKFVEHGEVPLRSPQ